MKAFKAFLWEMEVMWPQLFKGYSTRLYQLNKSLFNIGFCWVVPYQRRAFSTLKQLRRPETVEVGCPRHPGATTIGNQLQDGDRTDGWPNLTTQP